MTGEVFFYSKGSPEKMYSYIREADQVEAEWYVNELAKQGLRVLLYAAIKLDWARIEKQFYAARATQEEDGVAIQIFLYLYKEISINHPLTCPSQEGSLEKSVCPWSHRNGRSTPTLPA